ncbi:MAG TPA: hypothetical protein PKK82_01150 [Anaerolineaceae bacterium]|nr:hypothetical protein [Anaerolineaceae bacterium]
MPDQALKLPFEPNIPPALKEVLGEIPPREKPTKTPLMDEAEVERLLQLARIAGIPIVVDGGWAVDALLGWQTREHTDLDLAFNHRYLPKLLAILSKLSYQHIWRDDQWEHNFVLEDEFGHQVDIHTFITDEKGDITGGVPYPKGSLCGRGRIAHMDVACIEPHHLVAFHTGYRVSEKDYQDVRYLCNLFKIDLPSDYDHLINAK